MDERDALELKRSVSAGTGPLSDGARRIEVRRLIPASPAEIFEAWRDPEIMRRWYFPGPDWSSSMTHDFETGGLYHLSMIGKDGETFAHTGEYRLVQPDEKIVFTWNTPFVQDTLVTVLLRPEGDVTEVTIIHEFPAGTNVEMPGLHDRGWTGTLANMERMFDVS